jgi:hypothetical protein
MNTTTSKLDGMSSALALAAAITVLFNTGLAWFKDAYAPLNTFMAHLTGHHWITHGLADVLLFVVLGLIFANSGTADKIEAGKLTLTLIISVVVAGLGLAGWFFLT